MEDEVKNKIADNGRKIAPMCCYALMRIINYKNLIK